MRGVAQKPSRGLPWVLWALAGCSCGGAGDPQTVETPAHVFPADHLDRARFDPGPPPSLPAGARLGRVLGGVCELSIPLETASAHRLAEEPLLVLAWDLPWPASPDDQGGSYAARIDGLELPLVDPTAALDGSLPRGYGLVGEQLWLAPGELELPERFVLSYPVRSAAFAAHPDLAEAPVTEVLRGRRIEGQSARECLFLPSGSQLEFELPYVELEELRAKVHLAQGEAELEFSASVLGPESDARWAEGTCAVDGSPSPLRLGDINVGAYGLDTFSLALRVEGPPGGVLCFEDLRLSRSRRAEDPPNLIFVLVDTLRADRVGATGGTRGLTPELDAFAQDALVYEQCWSTCSWTLPSIATLLTSNHGGQHQAWQLGRRLGRGLDTLAEVLRAEGYLPRAVTDGVFLGQAFGLDRGFLSLDAFDHPESAGIEQSVARADELLREMGEGPWFLFLHTYEVHGPYLPPAHVYAEVAQRHGGPPVLGPEPHLYHDEVVANPDALERVSPVLEELYDEGVRHMDGQLGAWLNRLAQTGALDNVVVSLTSDHGEEFGEHGSLGHADTLYVEQLHVPWILRGPGSSGPRGTESAPVSQLDLAPTLLDVLGLGERLESTTFVGRSLFGDDASPVYASRAHPEQALLETLRSGPRVWIEGPYHQKRAAWPGEEPEVYELAEDPGQLRNLLPEQAQHYDDLEALFRRASATYRESRTTNFEADPGAGVVGMLNDAGYGGGD